MRSPRRTVLTLVLAISALVTLAACGGGSNSVQLTPDKAIALAKQEFDTTPGVRVTLAGKDLPGGNVLVSADGTLTRAPAFAGRIGVRVLGSTAQVPVVSVDDKVYAKLPLTLSWQQIDPSSYGVPDPATLIDPHAGISHLLTATTGLKDMGSVRGGQDNKEVLTTYTGTLPGSAVATIIPAATGSFAVSYTVGAKHQLEQAQLTGHFYGAGQQPSTYLVTLGDYGVTKTITAP